MYFSNLYFLCFSMRDYILFCILSLTSVFESIITHHSYVLIHIINFKGTAFQSEFNID